jgi:hypothetical protein
MYASRDPFTKGPEYSLTASVGSAAGSYAAVEKWPKCLRGYGEGSAEGKAERGLLMGVSSLTIKRRNQTGLQTKWARKRKALLKEAECSAGTRSGGFLVPVGKQKRSTGHTLPLAGQEKKRPRDYGRGSTSYAQAVQSSLKVCCFLLLCCSYYHYSFICFVVIVIIL